MVSYHNRAIITRRFVFLLFLFSRFFHSVDVLNITHHPHARTLDPQVKLPGGGTGSLFDAMEDLDATACSAKALAIGRINVDALYLQVLRQVHSEE